MAIGAWWGLALRRVSYRMVGPLGFLRLKSRQPPSITKTGELV